MSSIRPRKTSPHGRSPLSGRHSNTYVAQRHSNTYISLTSLTGLACRQARSTSILSPTLMDMPPPHLLMAALVSVLLLWQPADGTDHAVGGGGINGWDTGTNYATWAQSQSFAAGDVLGQYIPPTPSTQRRPGLAT
jgi:hypothetical protein